MIILLQEARAKKFRSLRSFLQWRLDLEKRADGNMAKWEISTMGDYLNQDPLDQRRQRDGFGIGHDGRVFLLPTPPPEECIPLDDPPVKLPNTLSAESGEDISENPFSSTPSSPAKDRDGRSTCGMHPSLSIVTRL